MEIPELADKVLKQIFQNYSNNLKDPLIKGRLLHQLPEIDAVLRNKLDAVLKYLEDLGVSVCNLDYPTTWNSFDMPYCTIGKNGYFRMHGRNEEKWFDKEAGRDGTYDYYYNEDEIAEIKKRIDKLALAFETLTIIANNHFRGAELANALELKALLSGQEQLVPESLLRAYPNLAKIALQTEKSQDTLW